MAALLLQVGRGFINPALIQPRVEASAVFSVKREREFV
jgi:hypothetical protein